MSSEESSTTYLLIVYSYRIQFENCGQKLYTAMPSLGSPAWLQPHRACYLSCVPLAPRKVYRSVSIANRVASLEKKLGVQSIPCQTIPHPTLAADNRRKSLCLIWEASSPPRHSMRRDHLWEVIWQISSPLRESTALYVRLPVSWCGTLVPYCRSELLGSGSWF